MEGAFHFGHSRAGKLLIHPSQKAIVEYWWQSTEEDFWLKFSDSDGNWLSYTAIVKQLADLQLAEDEKIAAIAKEKYGDAFASIFTYKKHGKTYVKSKSAHIAE